MPHLANSQETEIHNKFVTVASELTTRFPDLDLRFTLKGGTSRARFVAKTASRRVFELDLARKSSRQLIHEAIFSVKEVARLFDA